MKRQRAFSATELLVATTLLAIGVATACGGGDDSSSNSSGGGGSGGAAGSTSGGAGGKAGGSGGKGGKTGAGGETAGEQGLGGDDTAGSTGSPGPDEGGAGGESGAPDIDLTLKKPVYAAVKFPDQNPDSPAKDMLGKILFWDEQVGGDNTMACGTCHRTGAGGGSDIRAISNDKAFRNPGDDGIFGTADDIHGSQGIRYCTSGDASPVVYGSSAIFGTDHQVTNRKAPSYLDAMFAGSLFWDGRATTQFYDPNPSDPANPALLIPTGGALESQSVGPPMNPGEMACSGRTWNSLLAKLGTVTPLNLATNIPADMKAAITAAHGNYSELFVAAFGTGAKITAANFAMAIATHERHLQSNQTPWDLYNEYLNDPTTGDPRALTPGQVHGLQLFLGKGQCSGCHVPPFFSDFQFHNLKFLTNEKDLGRQALAGHASDPPSQVKTAGLRNVGLRSPEGLFHYGYGPGANLGAVIDAYNNPPNAITLTDIGLDGSLAAIRPLGLTDDERADLIDFLSNGLTDPRVQNQEYPFDKPTLSTE